MSARRGDRRMSGRRSSEERHALAVRGANDGLWDWDLVRETVYFSPRWQSMAGLDEREVEAPVTHWLDRVAPLDRPLLDAAIAAHLEGKTGHFVHEYRLFHTDGELRWMLARGGAVRDADGRATRFTGMQTDITERRRTEEALHESAFRDPLTGLANRAVLLDRLSQTLAMAARGDVGLPVLLDINLEGFRRLVETLGPMETDRLLVAVARRLESVAAPGDTVARLGGDDFALLIADPGDAAAAGAACAARVHTAVEAPFVLDGREIAVRAAVGVAVAETVGAKPAELLRNAAMAGHAARDAGSGRTAAFEHDMRNRADLRFELEAEMRSVLQDGNGDAGHFELFYQPIIDLLNGRKIDGFEALMRWRHPRRGLVSPAEFIPIAEETGLIMRMGAWAIMEACRQVAAFQRASGRRVAMAVNVSGRQFTESDLVAVVENALADSGIAPDALKLEVTESMVMNDPERASQVLRELMKRGVKVSIDDFGTGYSSLAYLHKLPFTTLKIDRSFVIRMGESPEGLEIVRTIVALARTLGRDLVAEGVEEEHQAQALLALNVDHGQGYLFGRPMPAADAAELLT